MGNGHIMGSMSSAITSSIEFPFTFTSPASSPSPSPRKSARRKGSVRRKKPTTEVTTGSSDVVGRDAAVMDAPDKNDRNRELIEGLCAAVGVVFLGWMGMWLVNRLVERGERVVK